MQLKSRVARPYSAPRERVWDMAIEQLVAQEFNWSRKSNHDVTMAIAKVRLATFLHPQFQFLLCSSSWLKTLLTQRTSHASS